MIIATIIYIIKKTLTHFPLLKSKLTGAGLLAMMLVAIQVNAQRLQYWKHLVTKKTKVKRSKNTTR